MHIVCDEGYHVAGNADPKCMEDESYDHPGKCVEVVCPPYAAPQHGSVEPTTSTEVGQHVNISCDVGYDIEGDASPVCQEDGTYSGKREWESERESERERKGHASAICQEDGTCSGKRDGGRECMCACVRVKRAADSASQMCPLRVRACGIRALMA